jgi:signal transduction histidine kinase
MHLSVMRKQNAINPEVVPDVISKIQGIIASTQNRVRGLEFGLYPKVVELSITDAVNGLLRRLTEERGSAIEYTSPPAIKCGRKSSIGLYRVLEQFFAQTHGRTRAWSVSLMESTAGVALSIRPTTAFPGEKEAMGVDVLTQEIVLAHGGRISMASEPHRIEIVFPKE